MQSGTVSERSSGRVRVRASIRREHKKSRARTHARERASKYIPVCVCECGHGAFIRQARVWWVSEKKGRTSEQNQ